MRALHKSLLAAAQHAADPRRLIRDQVCMTANTLRIHDRVYDLSATKRMIVIGAGKACLGMAVALEEVLAARLTSGCIIVTGDVNSNTAMAPRLIEVEYGSHPFPDERSTRATDRLLKHVEHLRSDDLVIVLISGGASSLMCRPNRSIGLMDYQQTVQILIKSGLPISDINAIRKCIDNVKGGQLLHYCHPARVITLVLSDVVGNDVGAVGSGPTIFDPDAQRHAQQLLQQHDLADHLPDSVVRFVGTARVALGATGTDTSAVHLVGTNRVVLDAVAHAARDAGLATRILTDSLRGEAAQVGRRLGKLLGRYARLHQDSLCLLAGGETTVSLSLGCAPGFSHHTEGIGGRNQELCLAAAMAIDRAPHALCVIAYATDGVDFHHGAAGAFVDTQTLTRARTLNFNPNATLYAHNSFELLNAANAIIPARPSGTNLNDIVMLLAHCD